MLDTGQCTNLGCGLGAVTSDELVLDRHSTAGSHWQWQRMTLSLRLSAAMQAGSGHQMAVTTDGKD